MKKSIVAMTALCAVVALSSCSSSKESAFKKAYDKYKTQPQNTYAETTTETQVPVVTPVEEPTTTAPVVTDNYENESVRRESLDVVNGAGLSNYSVVVGSFGVRANAEGLQQRLKNAGYDARLAYNSARNMYRVIASSYDSKAAAVQSRNQLRSQYPDAWLLAK